MGSPSHNVIKCSVADCRGFCCPHFLFNSEFAATIASAFARRVVTLFVDKFQVELRNCATGVLDLFDRFLASALSFESTWHPLLGSCIDALANNDRSSALPAAAKLALHLSFSGVGGDWEVELPANTILPCGEWFVVHRGRVAIAHTATNPIICVNGNPLSFGPSPTMRAIPLMKVTHPNGIIVVNPVLEMGWKSPSGLISKWEVIQQPTSTQISAIANALALMQSLFPEYHEWVTRIVQEVTLLRAHARWLKSGATGHPGSVYLTYSRHLRSVAEMLIHQASHQYHLLLTRVLALDNGSDRSAYFNPLVSDFRSLRESLSSFHAQVNVLLFYRQYLTKDLQDTESCRVEAGQLVSELRMVGNAVGDSPGLTDVGRAFVKPLIAAVNEH